MSQCFRVDGDIFFTDKKDVFTTIRIRVDEASVLRDDEEDEAICGSEK